MISVYLYADLPAVVLKNNQIAEGFSRLLVLRSANGPADFLYMIDLPADRRELLFNGKVQLIGEAEIRGFLAKPFRPRRLWPRPRKALR